MGLIEDAKRLAEGLASRGDGPWRSGNGHQMICMACEVDLANAYHADDCAWLAMPRIVAALEAAAALVKVIDRSSVHYPSTITNIKTGEQIPTCESYCSTWPCDAAKVDDAADALRDALAAGQ